MKEVTLIFPHQLFKEHPAIAKDRDVFIIEETLFFSYQKFHKQKLVFHRASMQFYADFLEQKGLKVTYVNATDDRAHTTELLNSLKKKGLKKIHYADPCDNYLEKRIDRAAASDIESEVYDSPMFLNAKSDLKPYFRADKKRFLMANFYKNQRKERGILLEGKDSPKGGQWSFDKQNRKKYPKDKTPPAIQFPDASRFYKEAVDYVNKNFADNYGTLGDSPLYPTDFDAATAWWEQFLEQRFTGFGPYEDAIVKGESILHHSVITPMLNTGLLTPEFVLDSALEYAAQNNIQLNTIEGFVRQIMGWREFMRGMYIAKGSTMRTTNYWNFKRKIPASFYTGQTGIAPVDEVIKSVLKTGYCHHIERLMVLGNFMLLCEFDPKEVYRWFMELFIDSYDWVMVPNVYGMSQFADGGLFATKPYISGSNYLKKMSNFGKGDWEDTWDALFWRFMDVHRDFFGSNPRLAMLLSNYDKMDASKKENIHSRAQDFFDQLDA